MTAVADIAVGQPVLRAWSAVTAYGRGREAFDRGVARGEPAPLVPVPEAWAAADARARFIADFDAVKALGRKGSRSLDRLTALALSAVGELLAEEPAEEEASERTALVLGTNGSTESMMNQTRTALTSARPFFVDAAKIPSTVLNCAAGRCAIWYSLTGPNATIATGRVAGLSALGYAGRLLRVGRADRVLCGAADEYGWARSWIDRAAGSARQGDDLAPGEGAVMFSLDAPAVGAEDAARGSRDERKRPFAEVSLLGVRQWVSEKQVKPDDVRACVRGLLGAAGIDPAEIWAVAPSSHSGPELPVLGDLFGIDDADSICIDHLLGDMGAASGSVQLAAVMSRAATDQRAPGRVAVITCVDPAGHLAAAAVRVGRQAVA